MTDSYEQALNKAKTDLAFALAQGDAAAEDDAAARIKTIEEIGRERWIDGLNVIRAAQELEQAEAAFRRAQS